MLEVFKTTHFSLIELIHTMSFIIKDKTVIGMLIYALLSDSMTLQVNYKQNIFEESWKSLVTDIYT